MDIRYLYRTATPKWPDAHEIEMQQVCYSSSEYTANGGSINRGILQACLSLICLLEENGCNPGRAHLGVLG